MKYIVTWFITYTIMVVCPTTEDEFGRKANATSTLACSQTVREQKTKEFATKKDALVFRQKLDSATVVELKKFKHSQGNNPTTLGDISGVKLDSVKTVVKKK